MERGAIKSEQLLVSQSEDGLRLKGSLISFDSFQKAQVSFISSAFILKNRSFAQQMIVSEDTMKLLGGRVSRKDCLSVHFNHPFALGEYKLELLPAGFMHGASMLHLESTHEKILYAPYFRVKPNQFTRNLKIKRCDSLILGAHYDPLNECDSFTQLYEKLSDSYLNSSSDANLPIVICNKYLVAPELAYHALKQNLPVEVQSGIYSVLRIHEALGCQIENYQLLRYKGVKNRLTLLDETQAVRYFSKCKTNHRPVIWIRAEYSVQTRNIHKYLQAYCPFLQVWDMNPFSQMAEIKQFIKDSGAGEVIVTGPYAKRFKESLNLKKRRILPIYTNNQPALF